MSYNVHNVNICDANTRVPVNYAVYRNTVLYRVVLKRSMQCSLTSDLLQQEDQPPLLTLFFNACPDMGQHVVLATV